MEEKQEQKQQSKALTRPEFDVVLLKMRSPAIKAVDRTTVLVEGTIDGMLALASFDLMANVGYLVPAEGAPLLP